MSRNIRVNSWLKSSGEVSVHDSLRDFGNFARGRGTRSPFRLWLDRLTRRKLKREPRIVGPDVTIYAAVRSFYRQGGFHSFGGMKIHRAADRIRPGGQIDRQG